MFSGYLESVNSTDDFHSKATEQKEHFRGTPGDILYHIKSLLYQMGLIQHLYKYNNQYLHTGMSYEVILLWGISFLNPH